MKKQVLIQEKNSYKPSEIEKKWQKIWLERKVYQPDLKNAKKPFYNLMMFPYPSAEGMHVGNMYAFTGADVYGRFQRMQGNDVFEPIGLDGFGIHSENYALKVGRHPLEQAAISQENFYRQLHAIGNGFDWSKTLETYDSNYYKWTQWLFIQLFKAGLAYRKKSPVSFCPSCKTVLADEQVIDGKCERCSSIVEKKELEQWFFKITSYADRLLDNLEKLDWTKKVKIAQKQWVGKKEGVEITYDIEDTAEKITVFTTRPDTNFGATFIVLAPEHLLVSKILRQAQNDKVKKTVRIYVEQAKKKSDIERQAEGREKTGVFIGLYAINQLTGKRMPIWISDYVLSGFGTGAVVGVPGHDKRDFEFAQKFDLEVIRVVVGKDGDTSDIVRRDQVQEEEGIMINSEFLDGMDINDALEKIMDYLEEKGYGKRVATYHLRDWLISRQRYWGPPIPMIYCQSCADEKRSWFDTLEAKKIRSTKSEIRNKSKILNSAAAGWYPEENLPVILPFIENYKPLGTGNSPLGSHPEFYQVTCPSCGNKATRETDVSDSFLDSSWYFFRYLNPDLKDKAFDSENVKKWLPVTMYIGGAEHSVLHLLYARFITMVLYDLGYCNFDEPFPRFYAHGLIIKDGAKMSKSKGNVVVPDSYIEKFGSDTLRTYLMFLGPYFQGGDFRDSGIEGMSRFLKRVWILLQNISDVTLTAEKNKMLHKTIKKVTEDIAALHYNTAIAILMEYYNFLFKQKSVNQEEAETFLLLLAPFAPHMAEELYQKLQPEGEYQSIHLHQWPSYNPSLLEENTVTIVIQINGKLRDTIIVSVDDLSRETIEEKTKKLEKVQKYLEGKTVRKVIYIPAKIINFVIS